MPAKRTRKDATAESLSAEPFERADGDTGAGGGDTEVHVLRDGIICDTEPRGHATPQGRSPLEIVLDASEGFIPLWARGMTLRWRFRESSMAYFKKPEAAKDEIRKLMGEALLAWGDAAPVKFAERADAWDFEIVMKNGDNCTAGGCVLASAFFPDAGRHSLSLYPRMFAQDRQEQLETMEHEIGHIFGLRHFFAKLSEAAWPSEIFGTHRAFSIMNYGSESRLTAEDRSDLKRLYSLAWSGELTNVNGTPIKFVKPFHTIAAPTENVLPFNPVFEPQPIAAYANVNRFGRQLVW